MTYSNVINTARETSSPVVSMRSREPVQSNVAGERVNTNESPAVISTQVDQVSISYASGVSARTLTSTDDRAIRITALQQTIVSGGYRVSASDLADGLMRSMVP